MFFSGVEDTFKDKNIYSIDSVTTQAVGDRSHPLRALLRGDKKLKRKVVTEMGLH